MTSTTGLVVIAPHPPFGSHGVSIFGWTRTIFRWVTGTLPPRAFARLNPPDWVADVCVTKLPGGVTYRSRLCLWPGRVVVGGTVSFLFIPGFIAPEEVWEDPVADRILELVGEAFTQPTPQTRTVVEDGLRTEVTLFRREPDGVMRHDLNLSAWDAGDDHFASDSPAVVRLARLLYEHLERHPKLQE
jgi:hypothetical protein